MYSKRIFGQESAFDRQQFLYEFSTHLYVIEIGGTTTRRMGAASELNQDQDFKFVAPSLVFMPNVSFLACLESRRRSKVFVGLVVWWGLGWVPS